MTTKQIITMVTAALLVIFNAGIIARIAKIYLDGQTDQDIDVNNKITNHLKALVIANTITGLVATIAKFYR